MALIKQTHSKKVTLFILIINYSYFYPIQLQTELIELKTLVRKSLYLYKHKTLNKNKTYTHKTLTSKHTCALIFDVRNSEEVEMKFYNMCPTTVENAATAE